jgi:hypothetical protein
MNLSLINPSYQFSCYDNLFSIKEPNGTLDINQLIEIIRYGYLKDVVADLRNTESKEAYSRVKQTQIPCVTLSGLFAERNARNLIRHSGLIQIDIDGVADYPSALNKLRNDPYTYVCFKSPGGKGIKIVVKIFADEETHLEQFYALEYYYLTTHQLTIDGSCKDLARCMLLSYDPDLYCNPFSEEFREFLIPETVGQIHLYPPPYLPDGSGPLEKRETITQLIAAILLKKTDITDSYESWIRIGYALSSEFGEAGRAYFHQLSQFHPSYNPTQCDKQYTSLHSRNMATIRLGTVIFYAKEKNIEVTLSPEKPETKQPEPASGGGFNPSNKSLLELLKARRDKIAHEKNLPHYTIFTDKTLEELAAKMPDNQKDFENTEGVTLKATEKYGQYFLPVIRKFKGLKGELVLNFGTGFQSKKSETYKYNQKEQEMYEGIKGLRLRISREEGIKPYMVFGNNTLSEIVQIKPTSLQQLLGISGIGQKKADWFGQEILDIVTQNR